MNYFSTRNVEGLKGSRDAVNCAPGPNATLIKMSEDVTYYGVAFKNWPALDI